MEDILLWLIQALIWKYTQMQHLQDQFFIGALNILLLMKFYLEISLITKQMNVQIKHIMKLVIWMHLIVPVFTSLTVIITFLCRNKNSTDTIQEKMLRNCLLMKYIKIQNLILMNKLNGWILIIKMYTHH